MLDYNCFTGNWPFHKIRKNTFADIVKLHQENGITGGYISSLESIFYNDPYESELDLYQELQGSGYYQVMTVNPLQDTCINTVIKGIQELDIKGVRIAPGYHHYSLSEPCISDLVSLLQVHQLPLFITMHFEDERSLYLMEHEAPGVDELKEFMAKNLDLEIMLCNIRYGELVQIKEEVKRHEHVHFDVSGFKDKLFPMTELRKEGLDKKVRFGSMAPLFVFESALLLFNEQG